MRPLLWQAQDRGEGIHGATADATIHGPGPPERWPATTNFFLQDLDLRTEFPIRDRKIEIGVDLAKLRA